MKCPCKNSPSALSTHIRERQKEWRQGGAKNNGPRKSQTDQRKLQEMHLDNSTAMQKVTDCTVLTFFCLVENPNQQSMLTQAQHRDRRIMMSSRPVWV